MNVLSVVIEFDFDFVSGSPITPENTGEDRIEIMAGSGQGQGLAVEDFPLQLIAPILGGGQGDGLGEGNSAMGGDEIVGILPNDPYRPFYPTLSDGQ